MNLLCRTDWIWTWGSPPFSASWMLGLQAWTVQLVVCHPKLLGPGWNGASIPILRLPLALLNPGILRVSTDWMPSCILEGWGEQTSWASGQVQVDSWISGVINIKGTRPKHVTKKHGPAVHPSNSVFDGRRQMEGFLADTPSGIEQPHHVPSPASKVAIIFRVSRQRNKGIWEKGEWCWAWSFPGAFESFDKPESSRWVEGTLDSGKAC